MKLRQLGKVGEFCNDASVPIFANKVEQTIGFRQLEYVVYKSGLKKHEVLPRTAGWVYCTNRRILMLDEGFVAQDGAQWKRYQEVPFIEARTVRYKRLIVWIDLETPEGKFTIAYTPYGAAARLFAWLAKERDQREKREAGELESAYTKERWYRHPPK